MTSRLLMSSAAFFNDSASWLVNFLIESVRLERSSCTANENDDTSNPESSAVGTGAAAGVDNTSLRQRRQRLSAWGSP